MEDWPGSESAEPRSSARRLENELGAQRDRVHRAADRGADRNRSAVAGFGAVDDAVQIIEHEAQIVVRIPVETEGINRLLAAGKARADQRARGEVVVEIDDAVAGRELEGSPTACLQREGASRRNSPIATAARSVFARFAGHGVARFDIAAIEIEIGQAAPRDVVVEIFRLREEGA